MLEEKCVVNLTGSRFVASRIVGELHVRYQRKIRLDRAREIAFHDLHMVDVVLQKEVVGTDFVDDLQRLPRARQVKTRNIAGIDRLDEQLDSGFLELQRRELEIADECRALPIFSRTRRADPCEAVQLLAVER